VSLAVGIDVSVVVRSFNGCLIGCFAAGDEFEAAYNVVF